MFIPARAASMVTAKTGSLGQSELSVTLKIQNQRHGLCRYEAF